MEVIMENFDNNLEEQDNNLFLYLFFIPILPSFCFAYLLDFLLLKRLKFKLSLILMILFLLFSISILLSKLLSTGDNLLILYLFINLILAAPLSLFFILSNMLLLKNHPELKTVNGWTYNFQYKKSLFEIIKEKKLKEKIKTGNLDTSKETPLGVLIEPVKLKDFKTYDKPHIVSRSYSEASKGTLITGATGSGKTIALLNLAYNDIKNGKTVIFIDLKRDNDIYKKFHQWAKTFNRNFYHFTSSKPNTKFSKHLSTYDILSSGSAESKVDMILGYRQWDTASSVYKDRTMEVLRCAFGLLELLDKPEFKNIISSKSSIGQLKEVLITKNLLYLITLYSDYIQNKKFNKIHISEEELLFQEICNELYEDLTKSKSIRSEQVEGIKLSINKLLLSNYSYWLSKKENHNHINLLNIATRQPVSIVLFQFDTNEEEEYTKIIGNSIIKDIQILTSKLRNTNSTDLMFYIDEFQSLSINGIKGVLEKARKSKIYTTLASQSLEHIISSSESNGESNLKSILDTIENFIIFNGATLESAERFSNLLAKIPKIDAKQNSKIKKNYLNLFFAKKEKNNISSNIFEDYMVKPSEFTDLTSPLPENNNTSTGWYLTKSTSNKDFIKLKSTKVARKFISIPNDEILK